jgi:hypothetical protein
MYGYVRTSSSMYVHLKLHVHTDYIYVCTHIELYVCTLWFRKKQATLFLTITLSNIDRFEYSLVQRSMNDQETNVCIQCPPHLTFVVALPGESLRNEFASQHNSRSVKARGHRAHFC